jgi:hypothetical protein
MGLAIYYDLRTKPSKVDDIRRLVGELRQYAMDFSFQEVEEVVEFSGNDVSHEDREDPHRRLKIQARRLPEVPHHAFPVLPLHIIAFIVGKFKDTAQTLGQVLEFPSQNSPTPSTSKPRDWSASRISAFPMIHDPCKL